MRTFAALAVAAALLVSCGSSGETAIVAPEKASAASTLTASADAVDGAIKALFAPYQASGGSDSPQADWDRPVFSARTAALVARWKRGFQPEEVIALQDFGWFCECQDWDAAKFKVEVLPHGVSKDGKIAVGVKFDVGFGEPPREMRFDLIDERGAWKIDDIRSESFDGGLRAALEQAIAHPL